MSSAVSRSGVSAESGLGGGERASVVAGLGLGEAGGEVAQVSLVAGFGVVGESVGCSRYRVPELADAAAVGQPWPQSPSQIDHEGSVRSGPCPPGSREQILGLRLQDRPVSRRVVVPKDVGWLDQVGVPPGVPFAQQLGFAPVGEQVGGVGADDMQHAQPRDVGVGGVGDQQALLQQRGERFENVRDGVAVTDGLDRVEGCATGEHAHV